MANVNLQLLKNALGATTLRQEAINSNIANVNTENYKVNQVAFESLLSEAATGVNLRKTQANHLGARTVTEIEPLVTKRTNTIVKENGNNVDLDMEMVDLAENTLYYQALTSQLNSQYSRLKTIISG